MKRIRINENNLINTIKKIINENDDFVTGISASEKTELIDDVINRLNEFGLQYKIELNRLNLKFNPQKVKRIERPRSIDDLDLPKGLRIGKTIFPESKLKYGNYLFEQIMDDQPITTITTTQGPSNSENIDPIIPETVEIAKQYIGKPYVYGSQGPNSFDCSGFVRYVLSEIGVIDGINDTETIPRTASGIYASPSVTKISFNELQPGDLVFFKSGSKISHIGLVSNVETNDKNEKIFHMVHASSSSGIQDTEETSYTKNGVNKTPYWSSKIAGYGRM